MKDEEKLIKCQETIGYSFKNPDLLKIALTHSSIKSSTQPSNERLEFLGDSVLGFIISEYLFKNHPDLEEGEMTQIKSVVVSRPVLAAVSDKVTLWKFLFVGKGLRHSTADKQTKINEEQHHGLPGSLLSNAFEAVIGAIYLDNGIEKARKFILDNLAAQLELVQKNQHKKNYKSMLQELLQKELGVTPVYSVINEEGPEHSKNFEVIVCVNDAEKGRARGRTKREAEQNAAMEALHHISPEENE